MKFQIAVVAALAAVVTLAGNDPAKDEILAATKTVRNYSVHTLRQKVTAQADEGLKVLEKHKDAACKGELSGLRVAIVAAYQRTFEWEKGLPIAERLYADTTANYGQRAVAADFLVARTLAKDETAFAAADAIYEKLQKGPQLPDVQKFELIGRRASLLVRRGDQAAALAYVNGERDAIKGAEKYVRDFVRPRLAEKIAQVYHDFCDYQGELDFWLREGNKSKALGVMTGGFLANEPLANRLAREVVTEAKKPGDALSAWLYLFQTDAAFAEANVAKVDDGTPAAKKALAQLLAPTFTRANVNNVYGSNSPCYFRNWALVAKTWEYYLPRAQAAQLDVLFAGAQYATIAYAALGERAKAVAAAEAGLANAKLTPAEAYELKAMAAILKLRGTDEKALCEELCGLESKLSEGIAPNDRKDRFHRAAVVATVSKDDAVAHAVAAFIRRHADATPEKRVYTVKYTPRSVGGVGDWENIPFKPEESDFSRKFGTKELSFMLTDVATGDRGEAAKGAAEQTRKYPTTLQAVADEWGVHIVFTFYDKRARQFESGELSAGSYENYIAPGENQPYACFLCYPKKDADGFIMNTAYDTPGHRRTDLKNFHQFRTDVRFEDDRVMTYCAFSWDVFADHVPVDGGEWDFESVFWGPVPSAWNGTKTIHGRSTWGKLRFELGEGARTKIMRAQLYKVVANYRLEKTAKGPNGTKGAQGGILDFWKDEAYGDPEFYEAVLAPRVAELDAVAERVKVAMTDAEVREICEKYFARFHDLHFTISRLRAEYMKEGLVK